MNKQIKNRIVPRLAERAEEIYEDQSYSVMERLAYLHGMKMALSIVEMEMVRLYMTGEVSFAAAEVLNKAYNDFRDYEYIPEQQTQEL